MSTNAERRSGPERFDGDYDEIEIRREWQEENTLHEWDEGEFQLEPLILKRVKPQPMNGMSDSYS